jgi:hypothetical protein
VAFTALTRLRARSGPRRAAAATPDNAAPDNAAPDNAAPDGPAAADRAAAGSAPAGQVVRAIQPGWRAALLAAGAAVWLARGWPRIAHPTLWAEDGPIFAAGAYRHPLHAFVEPYNGYLHTVPRLVALLAGPLPLTWLPTLYALAAVAGAVATTGLVLSPRMRGLLPRRWQPPLAFGLLTVLPAADETFGNIANLVFYAGLALLLLSLCGDPRGRAGGWLELAVLAVLGLSGPFAVLVLPGFVARWWRTRSGHSLRALAVVAATGAVQWAILLGSPRTTAGFRPGSMLAFLGRDVAGSWLFGDRWRGPWTAGMAVAVLAFGAAFAVVACRRAALGPLVSVLLAVASAMTAYHYWLVRPYVGQRHLLLPFALIVLLAVAGLADRPGWRRVVAAGCLLAGLGGIAADIAIRPLPFWPIGPLADCLAARHPVCQVTINPHRRPWIITLSPKG